MYILYMYIYFCVCVLQATTATTNFRDFLWKSSKEL